MKTIIVKNEKSDNLIEQFIALYLTLVGVSKNEKVTFDLTDTVWLYPMVILPIASYIIKTKSEFKNSKNDKTKGYLDTIKFPKGINSINEFSLRAQTHKNYVPISALERNKGLEREKLETMFSEMMIKSLGSVKGAESAILYPIGELITNIFEHSNDDLGLVFGQYYPKKSFLDICIVDSGRGLRRAYAEDKNIQVRDDEAIKKVLEGESIKAGKDRGYGVWTSKRMVCEALGGQFILISGSAAFIASQKKQKLLNMPNFYWEGVIISYRIPKPAHKIDITPYLE